MIKDKNTFRVFGMVIVVAVIAFFVLHNAQADNYDANNLVKTEEINDMLVNPNNYVTKSIDITGQITEVISTNEDTTNYLLTLDETYGSYSISITASNKLLEGIEVGDFVQVQGYISSVVNYYETDMINVSVDFITEISYALSYDPAVTSLLVNTGVEKDGIEVYVNTIEIGNKETRMMIKVTNNTDSDITMDYNNITLNIDGTTYSTITNEFATSEMINTTIKAGEEVSGLVLFEPFDYEKTEVLDINVAVNVDGKVVNYKVNIKSN